MPWLVFESEATCPTCGAAWKSLLMNSYRINKNSFKALGMGLTCAGTVPPEAKCNHGEPEGLDKLRPDEESLEIINRHRERKGWDPL